MINKRILLLFGVLVCMIGSSSFMTEAQDSELLFISSTDEERGSGVVTSSDNTANEWLAIFSKPEDNGLGGSFIVFDSTIEGRIINDSYVLKTGDTMTGPLLGDNVSAFNFLGRDPSGDMYLWGSPSQDEPTMIAYENGNVTVNNNISAFDITLRNPASLWFGDPPIGKMGAVFFTVDNRSRSVISADADFSVDYSYNGSVIMGAINKGSGTISSTAVPASNYLGHDISLGKFSPEFVGFNETGILFNEHGRMEILNSNNDSIFISYYDFLESLPEGSVTGINNITHVVEFMNNSNSFNTNFNYNVTMKDDLIVEGALYGASPLEVSGGLTLLDGLYQGDGGGLFNLSISTINGTTSIEGDLFVNGTLNVTGNVTFQQNVTIEENLEVQGNITGNVYHGEMWNYTSGGWTFPIDATNVYYNMTGLIPGSLNGFSYTSETQANGGSYLTAEVGSLYRVSFSISYSAGIAGGQYGIGVARNFDITGNRQCYSRGTGQSNVVPVTVTCFMELEEGDTVNIQLEDETAPAKDMTIYTANLNFEGIGD